MKTRLYALLLSTIFFSCTKDKKEISYTPRVLITNEEFNEPLPEEGILTINSFNANDANSSDPKEWFGITYKNTVVRIQTDPADKTSGKDKFAFAKFINTQKTCLLVQIADSSGLVSPFYLIAIKNHKLEVVSLYRASSGLSDTKFTTGLNRIGNTGYLINNDFFVTNVNAKVYLLRRQNPKERIQGDFFMVSPDKYTLVFVVSSSFYELHYPTGEIFIQPIDANTSLSPTDLYKWIQDKYSWQKNRLGISFLKENHDDDKIIDMRKPM